MLRTVGGDVDPSTMGATLPHEHVLIDIDSYWEPGEVPLPDSDDPTASPRIGDLWHWLEFPCANRGNLHMNNEADAIAELSTLEAYGIGTLVELTSIGIGRKPVGLARVSEATGVNIVAGSSYYLGAAQSDEVKSMTEDLMVEQIVNDITVGIDGTDIRAGVIGEVGLSWPIEPVEERVLAASVRAQQITGAAISIHNPYYVPGAETLREITQRIADLGADMSRVIMGHCDGFARDPKFLDIAPELGCYIEFDLFGQFGYEPDVDFTYPSDGVRIEAIIGLAKAGLADRVLLSQDVAFKTSMQTHGGHGYTYVPRTIVPWLKRRGMDDSAVHQIMVRNAQQVFPIASERL